MFKFFTNPKWYTWAYLGSVVILTSIWVQVQIDVKINEWFGEFYDMIQKALGTPNAIEIAANCAKLKRAPMYSCMVMAFGVPSAF